MSEQKTESTRQDPAQLSVEAEDSVWLLIF